MTQVIARVIFKAALFWAGLVVGMFLNRWYENLRYKKIKNWKDKNKTKEREDGRE